MMKKNTVIIVTTLFCSVQILGAESSEESSEKLDMAPVRECPHLTARFIQDNSSQFTKDRIGEIHRDGRTWKTSCTVYGQPAVDRKTFLEAVTDSGFRTDEPELTKRNEGPTSRISCVYRYYDKHGIAPMGRGGHRMPLTLHSKLGLQIATIHLQSEEVTSLADQAGKPSLQSYISPKELQAKNERWEWEKIQKAEREAEREAEQQKRIANGEEKDYDDYW